MNWLDWILLVVIAGSIIASFRTGFSRELIGLISMIVALFCSLWFYGSAGAFLLPYVSSKEIAHLCGFLIVFLGVLIAGAIIGVLFSRLVKAAGLGLFDRILGAGFGAVRGLLFAVALILAIVAFSPGGNGGLARYRRQRDVHLGGTGDSSSPDPLKRAVRCSCSGGLGELFPLSSG